MAFWALTIFLAICTLVLIRVFPFWGMSAGGNVVVEYFDKVNYDLKLKEANDDI